MRVARTAGCSGVGGQAGTSTYPGRGMRVRQSPVCASHTHTWPARQQLTSSMPSLARHSMSCGDTAGHGHRHWRSLALAFPPLLPHSP